MLEFATIQYLYLLTTHGFWCFSCTLGALRTVLFLKLNLHIINLKGSAPIWVLNVVYNEKHTVTHTASKRPVHYIIFTIFDFVTPDMKIIKNITLVEDANCQLGKQTNWPKNVSPILILINVKNLLNASDYQDMQKPPNQTSFQQFVSIKKWLVTR